MKSFHIFIIFRCVIGLLFIVSGFEKATSPAQNFMYVIESYAFLPDMLIKPAAYILPWIELSVGLFLVLGFWLKQALFATALLFLSFQCILGQAIVRKLPIDECGCFGEAFTVPMPVMFLFDATMFALTLILIWKIQYSARCSLDNYFQNS